MKRFVEGQNRRPGVSELQDDCGSEGHLVREIGVFVDELALSAPGLVRAAPLAIRCPGYHPDSRQKLYVCCYLNQVAAGRWPARQVLPIEANG